MTADIVVSRTAADDEIRRAYKRQREIFREGGLPTVSIVGAEALRKEQARIEEAHDTLLDPVRRRSYDLSTYPDDPRDHVAPRQGPHGHRPRQGEEARDRGRAARRRHQPA